MHKNFVRFCSLLFFICLLGRLEAQMSPADALQLRADMANAVLNGLEKAADAIARLGKTRGSSGLDLEAGADLALACTDLGQRLLGRDRGAEAMQFFKAAEAALTILVRTTPDAKAAQKANYLQQLAFIRGRYLGQTEQAKLDIDQATALQPDDKNIQRIKTWVGNAHGSVFKERAVAPKKDKRP